MEKNKKMEIYKNLILDVPGVKTAKFEKSIESLVTTSWGVNWDADFIARDILQNFRDALVQAKKDIDQVQISTENDQISVYAPTEFSLAKLFFIGSQRRYFFFYSVFFTAQRRSKKILPRKKAKRFCWPPPCVEV